MTTEVTREVAAPVAPAGDAILVQAVDLCRDYRVGSETVHALRNINLSVVRGQFCVFKGRSGSGKTTLLNLLAGLDQPTSGQAFLFGREIGRMSERERTVLRRERIGFVFQSFSLVTTFSAFENVEIPLRMTGMEARARRERVMRCLALVGLHKWASHRPFEMSGGQQQRLSIARALAQRPPLMIADEPTSELDSETGRQIMALFQRLVRDEGVTILMASHDPRAVEFATDVYQLKDGAIEEHITRPTGPAA